MLEDAVAMTSLAADVDAGEPRERWLDYAINTIRAVATDRPTANLDDPYLDASFALFDRLTGHDTPDLVWNIRRMAHLSEIGTQGGAAS